MQAALADVKAFLEERKREGGMGGNSFISGTEAGTESRDPEANTHSEGSWNPSPARWHDRSYRGDVMRWLHADEERAAGREGLVEILDLLAGLRSRLADMG